jgi:heme/copper-type cytochrome/quinol oxidase subunit 3
MAAPPFRFTGLLAILAATTMFFTALASAYIVRRGLAADWIPVRLPSYFWITSVLLLASCAFLSIARSLKHAKRRRLFWSGAATAGSAFLVLIASYWKALLLRSSVPFTRTPSAAFFYVLTVAFSVLVFTGVVWLLTMLLGRPAASLIRTNAAQIYWAYLAGLWLFLLGLFYLWR